MQISTIIEMQLQQVLLKLNLSTSTATIGQWLHNPATLKGITVPIVRGKISIKSAPDLAGASNGALVLSSRERVGLKTAQSAVDQPLKGNAASLTSNHITPSKLLLVQKRRSDPCVVLQAVTEKYELSGYSSITIRMQVSDPTSFISLCRSLPILPIQALPIPSI